MSSVRPVVAVAVLVLTVVALSTVASASATTGSADSPVDTEAATDAATAGGATPTDAATEATDATPNETDRNATDAAVVQTVTYERTPERPGWIRATYQYRIGPNASTVVVYDYEEALVVESRGFVGEKDGRWRWNGRTPTPTITMRLKVNRTSRERRGLGWVDTGDWTLAYPRTGFAFRSQSRNGWVYSWQQTPLVDQRTRVVGPGFAGSAVVYLGEHEMATTTAAGQRFRVIRPTATTEPRTRAVLRTLARAGSQLRVGARDERVNAFVGPRPLGGGGVTARGDAGAQDFWVAARERIHVPRNLWVHEYVHTRQNASLGPRMTWFREASATYYAGLLSVRQGLDGRAGFERFLARLHGNHSAAAVLADPSTWERPLAPYRRGERVLAALDARIRAATDRNRTLQDVFRRINRFRGVVDYDDFVRMVGNVSGTDLSGWLDAHVAGNERVDPPDRPTAYTAPALASDADGDRLSERVERRVGTHPFDPDTDGDGVPDPVEVALDSDPTDADSVPGIVSDLTRSGWWVPGVEAASDLPAIDAVTGDRVAW